jgi:hypothetical protein
MSETSKSSRRQWLKMGAAAIAIIPVAVLGGKSYATTNASMRTALKYQNTPSGDKSCSGCMQFVPGKTPKDLGGCKVMAGDTEISPSGYCSAWVKK